MFMVEIILVLLYDTLRILTIHSNWPRLFKTQFHILVTGNAWKLSFNTASNCGFEFRQGEKLSNPILRRKFV